MSGRELALTESRTLRELYADRTDVLDKVKALALLPDGVHADIPMVATYFEVTVDAIEKIVQRHREELEGNGLNVLRGEEYRRFAADNLSAANPRARSITLFNRRTLLNTGQLLRDSEVARQVREYLLDAEARPVEMSKAEWIRQALEIEEARERLAVENAKLRVKADAFDLWLNGKGCYLVGTVAKMLNLGPKVLWDFLYDEGLLIKAPGTKRHREPYSRRDTRGWFEVEPVPPERANGHATKTTGITPYGAEQIRLRLIKRGVLPPAQLALIEGDGA